MVEKKIFFFDVDGTLVDSDEHIVPESTIHALARLHELGHILCISTGRSLDSVIEAGFDQLINWDIYLCNNGQAIYDQDKKTIQLVPIPQHAVEACLKKAEELNSPLLIMGEKNLLTKEPDENVLVSSAFFNESLPPVMEYDGSAVVMMIAYAPFGYDYHDYADIKELTFIPGQSNYSDVVLKGFNKHSGIQLVLKHLGMQEYIAFGDSLNDVEMIKEAACGIAMGNSCEEIKEIADYITEDVMHDGIYHALKKLSYL